MLKFEEIPKLIVINYVIASVLMNGDLSIRHHIVGSEKSSELTASSATKSDTIGNLGIIAFSEQKTLKDHLKTPIEERRLSQVLPPCNGPHLVGRSSVIIEIPESHFSNCNKKIGIEIFAPTRNLCGNKVLLELIDDNFKQIMGMREEDSKKAEGDSIIPLFPQLNEEQIQTLHTHSLDTLDPIENMPILIFSHGLRLDPTVYRPLVEELASHGYIVLNLNHPASSSRAPLNSSDALDVDAWDKLMTSSKEEYEKKEQDIEKLKRIDDEIDVQVDQMIATEADNIRFVVEQLRSGNLKGLPKDCGNKNPIILAGHSLGGTVSMVAAKDNPHIKGCIDLDGRLAGKNTEERTAKLEVPTLLLFIEREDPEIAEFLKNNEHAKQKVIKGVEHTDFTIYPIIDWVAGGNRLLEGHEAHEKASKAMRNFMDKLTK